MRCSPDLMQSRAPEARRAKWKSNYCSLSREGRGKTALLRCLPVGLHRRAGADEVAVAGDVVDAADRRPVLVLLRAVQREEGPLFAVGPGPVRHQQVVGMRRV